MIKLFRIDERLIHGQIAIKWSRHTGVDSIVVANNNAAANTMIQKSLKMAAPPGIKTVIKSIDDAIKTLNDPRSGSGKQPGRCSSDGKRSKRNPIYQCRKLWKSSSEKRGKRAETF